MATPYTRYQYKSPQAVDADTMGKVASLKQQKYDANVAQVSEVVSQFANMNLLRPQDEEYLGKRLQQIVNYVDQAGAKDFSNMNVAREITSYVSSALDQNVAAAIQSTQAYQRQKAAIEKIRTDDPDKYNIANEWLATAGLEDYMNADIGAVYQPNSYIPYVDIRKRLIENADIIKDFGEDIDVSYSDTGNLYIKRKSTQKILSPEAARPLIEMIIGKDGMQQIMIDSQYNGKDLSNEQVDEYYGSFINKRIEAEDKKISYLKDLLPGMTKEEKKVTNQNIALLQQSKEDLIKNREAGSSRSEKLFTIEKNQRLSQLSKGFSYKRETDVSFDTTLMDVAEFEWDRTMDSANLEMKRSSMEIDILESLSEGKLLRNEDGSLSYNPNYVSEKANAQAKANTSFGGGEGVPAGITQSARAELTEEENLNVLSETVDNYNIRKLSFVENLANEKGISLEEAEARAEVMRKKSVENIDSRHRYEQSMKPSLRTSFNEFINASEKYNLVEGVIDETRNSYVKILKSLNSSNAVGDYSPLNTLGVISEDKNLIDKFRKVGFDKLTPTEKEELIVRTAINRTLDTQASPEQKSIALSIIENNKLNLTEEEFNNKFNYSKSKGFIGNTTAPIGDILSSAASAGKGMLYAAFGKTKAKNNAFKESRNAMNSANNKIESANRQVYSRTSQNYVLSDLEATKLTGLKDENGIKIDFEGFDGKNRAKIKNSTRVAIEALGSLKEAKVDQNIDLESKLGKQFLATAKLGLNEGESIDKNQLAKFSFNEKTGNYDVTVGITDAGNRTFELQNEFVPSFIKDNTDYSTKNPLYDYKNPAAIPVVVKDLSLYENDAERLNEFQILPDESKYEIGSSKRLGPTQEEVKEVISSRINIEELEKTYKDEVEKIISSSYTFEPYKNSATQSWTYIYSSSDGSIKGELNTNLKNLSSIVEDNTKKYDLITQAMTRELYKYTVK